jgi:hypothetical protein
VALWSERQGKRRGLNNVDLRDALFEVFVQLEKRMLFTDAWGERWQDERTGGYIDDPERWVRESLKDASLWQYLDRPWTVTQEWDPEWAVVPKPKKWSFSVLFDMVELLDRDAVAVSTVPEDVDQTAGRRVFRDAVNPVLAQLEPPKVLTEEGQITESASVAKQSILEAIIQRSAPAGGPALADEVYMHILEIIDRVGRGMELAPGTYRFLGEEARRDIYLVTLNTHYEDSTAGEAFNHAGKTDLRVRNEGDNVFIGECKVWHGPESFTEALDQLFSYTAWRDTKLALIVFVPNQKLSAVIKQARKRLEEHDQFLEWSSASSEQAWLRAVVRWRQDDDQHADLSAVFVHLPE